ncbi:MAG: YibE/F family protein [Oscillospiraceae bacterium]|nr:YibE/F family protein [Oscillospiraceae bacterium]
MERTKRNYGAFLARMVLVLALLAMISLTAAPALADDHELTLHDSRDLQLVRGRVLSCETVSETQKRVEVELTATHERIWVDHFLSSHPAEIQAEPGDRILLYRQPAEDGGYIYYITSYLRERGLACICLLFAALMLLVGRGQGFKSLIPLVIVALLVWRVLVPMIMNGMPPMLAAMLVCILSTAATMLLVGGITRKSAAATAGVSGGLAIAGLLAAFSGRICYLSGFSSDYVSAINYSGDFSVDPKGLLAAAMLIGALGAVMDVGMGIASAVSEVKEANPELGWRELFRAGMNVGRDMMGTMSNTLILAYVGTSLALILLFCNYGISLTRIFNLDMIATEVVRMLTGSIGLIVTVPLSALVSGLLMSRK